MAEKNSVPGSIIGLTIKDSTSVLDGVWLPCQTDATLNLGVETEEEDPCKPTPEELETLDKELNDVQGRLASAVKPSDSMISVDGPAISMICLTVKPNV